jgi:hypothetical protein
MAHWLRMQLADGSLNGKRIVSAESLAVTHMARVAVTEKMAYAMGWMIQSTPNGTILWHNGGTPSFGAYVGLLPDRKIGVVVLTNEANSGFPDAVGLWTLDRLLGNPEVDHVAEALIRAKDGAAKNAARWAKPADPRPYPAPVPLTGTFTHPAIGKVNVKEDGDGLAMEFPGGAALKLAPWDGGIFTATLAPIGPSAAVVQNLGPSPFAFAQFQMNPDGRLGILRITADDGQSYEFKRE